MLDKKLWARLALVAVLTLVGFSQVSAAPPPDLEPCASTCFETLPSMCSTTRCNCAAFGGALTLCTLCPDNNCICVGA